MAATPTAQQKIVGGEAANRQYGKKMRKRKSIERGQGLGDSDIPLPACHTPRGVGKGRKSFRFQRMGGELPTPHIAIARFTPRRGRVENPGEGCRKRSTN